MTATATTITSASYRVSLNPVYPVADRPVSHDLLMVLQNPWTLQPGGAEII